MTSDSLEREDSGAGALDFPGVRLPPGADLHTATDLLAAVCEDNDEHLYALDPANRLEPTGAYCHFFQTELEERECIVAVMVGDWTEDALVRVLNILIEIRTESGWNQPPLFRFCSVAPVPSILVTIFGDSPTADFECRAVPVVRFGTELRADEPLRIAAVAMYLLRETFGVRIGLYDESGERKLAQLLSGRLVAGDFPNDGVPLNLLIALGCLYGERQRARIPFESHWVLLKDLGPWPSVIFHRDVAGRGSGSSTDGSDDREGDDGVDDDVDTVKRVAFSPISVLIGAFQRGRAATARRRGDGTSHKVRRGVPASRLTLRGLPRGDRCVFASRVAVMVYRRICATKRRALRARRLG